LLAFSRRNRFTEGQLRSVAKVVTWRVLVTLTNFLGGFIVSGNWRVGLGVAGFALVVNSILYWFHERCWNTVPWNKRAAQASGWNAGGEEAASMRNA
jgi:uncharacterized membrane protein